jgi:hypothetical protein
MFTLATRVLLWMTRASIVLIGLNLVTVIVGLLVKRSRAGCVLLLSFSTWLWAATFTLWCALQVLSGWGVIAMMVGLFLGIVGIIPDAFLRLIATRQWGELLKIVGWSGSTMVLMAKRYGHFSLNELRDAVESISALPASPATQDDRGGDLCDRDASVQHP